MIIYEVNLMIECEIYDVYCSWLYQHIKDILKFNGFIKADVWSNNDSEQPSKKQLTVMYVLDSKKSLQRYFEIHAASMREDGIKRFGTKFSATRRILEHVHYFES